jgi:hypothetical protein
MLYLLDGIASPENNSQNLKTITSKLLSCNMHQPPVDADNSHSSNFACHSSGRSTCKTPLPTKPHLSM